MSEFRFVLYSSDATDPLDPDTASTVIEFPQPAWGVDPFDSEYEEEPAPGFGGVAYTLGGVVVQDHGAPEGLSGGGVIRFSDVDALDAQTYTALRNAYAQNAWWYFSNGVKTYKVRFSRDPAGFRAWRNIYWASRGLTYYSYEIRLIVLEEVG